MSERNVVLEAYYVANRRQLIKKVSGRAGTPENAEDIMHNAFVKALAYWGSFNPQNTDLESWFGRILNNALKDFMRDDRRYGTTEEFDEELYEGVKMASCDNDMLAKIRGEFKFKNAQNREILELSFNHHHTPQEVMEIMDIKYKTIEQCLSRFKSEIREKYGAVV